MSVHNTRLALLVAALVAGSAGTSLAGPIYSWNWNAGDAGNVDNGGGTINWVQTTFDTNTNRLSWYGNFGNGTRIKTDGFTLTLRSGDSPRTAASEVAQIYFDGKDTSVDPTQVPTLSAYGHNGLSYTSSWMDGAPGAGVQTPDRIKSSAIPPASEWVYSLSCIGNADGTRTMGFEIDATDIIGHTPIWPGTGDWSGASYDQTIGVYMETFYNLDSDYDSGYLSSWACERDGFLEISSASTSTVTDPVPEPATLTLLGLGAAGLFGFRRRQRQV